MAEILKSCGVRRKDCLISFVVVGPAELCHKIAEGLNWSAKEREWNVLLHLCESVTQVVRSKLDLGVDFVIFAFDWRTSQSLSEVETNIGLIDEYYIVSGAACLVNCNGVSNVMELTSYKSWKIRNDYNVRFLSANVSNARACVRLGNRILNVVEAVLGIESGLPTVGFLARYD